MIADGDDKTSPLKNRIRKNYRHVRKWANRTLTNSFRVYDRDIKEYPLAIDFYDGRFCVHYFSESKESSKPREDLYEAVTGAICSIFGVSEERIHSRTRIKRERTEQYEKFSESRDFFTVLEYGVKFRVNLVNYLDTGLFLDHRETRQMVAAMAHGKRLLNLFAYTCSFSVHAALKGAAFTKSVDLSNTYTEWGKFNYFLNGISLKNHVIVREDCLKLLEEEEEKYDIIVIDPPTISRSKRMDQMFDIQTDYVSLITNALKLLEKGGVIFFSTNSRRFSLDESQFPEYRVQDISKKTIPVDFHNQKVHRCWKLY